MIMIHGRGAGAENILTLADELHHPDFLYLAPQAFQSTWYPYSFLAPIPENEPGISSAIEVIKKMNNELIAAGIPQHKIIVLGFSQGACLALEFAARNVTNYGGIIALSGGLIGPDGTPRNYEGTFHETPVFLGCSDMDPHIPAKRVLESTKVFERMGARVTERIYPNMGHTINMDEVAFVKTLMSEVVKGK
jgi:predicted esterase